MAANPSRIRDYAIQENMHVNASPFEPKPIDLEAQPAPQSADGASSPADSVHFRKVARSNTARTYRPERKTEWLPGSEPGIDVSSGPQLHADLPKIHEDCDITVVDFSQEDMKYHRLVNATIEPFLQHPRPAWSVWYVISQPKFPFPTFHEEKAVSQTA